MEPDFEPPVLKDAEPLPVPPLTELFLKQGILSAEQRMIWIGNSAEGVRFVVDADEASLFKLSVLTVCSDEEKIIGQAFQDWYNGAVRAAAEMIKGYWTLDVLQFEIRDVPRSWNEFALLIRNHAAKMNIDERRLIQFGTLYFVLHYRSAADFGKIETKLKLEYCKPSAESLARWVRKQAAWKNLTSDACFVIRDLTRTAPLFSDAPEAQQDFQALLVLPPKTGQLPCRSLFYWHAASSGMIAFSGRDSV